MKFVNKILFANIIIFGVAMVVHGLKFHFYAPFAIATVFAFIIDVDFDGSKARKEAKERAAEIKHEVTFLDAEERKCAHCDRVENMIETRVLRNGWAYFLPKHAEALEYWCPSCKEERLG